jgi:hypothetical protein
MASGRITPRCGRHGRALIAIRIGASTLPLGGNAFTPGANLFAPGVTESAQLASA